MTSQIAMWTQTKATQAATEAKIKKAEKNGNKENTPIKAVNIEEGVDDATTKFHPQRYAMRPPVGGPGKIWDQYPTHWNEVYYSVNLADVGLENQLGHEQIRLLHDRRSKLLINMMAPVNANIGISGFKTTNLKMNDNGSADIMAMDNWAAVVTVKELMMALDNLVAAWACFWEGDRSMVTLRRVVTKMKEFACVENVSTRLKLLEAFINKVLEINQRKAIQKDLPLTFKEAHDLAKEYVENVHQYIPKSGRERNEAGTGGTGGGFNNRFQSNKFNRERKDKMEELTRKFLAGHKIQGKEFCVNYNLKDERGGPRCKNRNCSRAHNCGFIPRGEIRPCGKLHSKFEHSHKN